MGPLFFCYCYKRTWEDRKNDFLIKEEVNHQIKDLKLIQMIIFLVLLLVMIEISKECLELFNEYKDILIPSQPKETEEVKTDDMCSAILQELNEMKNDKKTGPTMTPKDLGSNCLSYLQVTD